MTTDHITITSEAATLTEKQLWARFVDARIQTTYSMGPTVDSYCPADLLADPGLYGKTEWIAREIANELAEASDPHSVLDCTIDDLTAYLEGLRTVRDAFVRIKNRLAIDTDGAEDDGEVRYCDPSIQNTEAAH